MDLRANTPVDVLIGPFVDGTNGKDTEEAESPVVLLSKNGQALAAKSDVTTPVHDNAGYYNCELDATDLDTEGNLALVVEDSANALPVRHEFNVMAEAAWDSLYVAKDTGFMDVNVKAVSEDTTAADNLELACDNYSVTRGLTGTALPAAVADAAGGVPVSDLGGLDLDTILGRITANVALASVCTEARLAELGSTNLPADVDTLLTRLSSVRAGYLDNLSAGAVALASVCTSARLGELDPANLPADIDTLLARLSAVRAGYLDNLSAGAVALASVVGALNDAAVDGDPTATDTLMQYIKQLINILVGTAGVVTFPVEAAPANAVSLAEVIRAIYNDTVGLAGDVMRGTNSAALATVATEARLAELDAANLPADVDTLIARLTAARAGYLDSLNGHIAQTGDNYVRLGPPAGASHAADNAAIKAETALIVQDTEAPKKNTAFNNLSVFMVDSTDDVSGKTGLSLGVTRSIDGAAFGAGTGTAAEISNGMYQYDASAADMNGDVIIFRFTGTGANDTFITVHTRP